MKPFRSVTKEVFTISFMHFFNALLLLMPDTRSACEATLWGYDSNLHESSSYLDKVRLEPVRDTRGREWITAALAPLGVRASICSRGENPSSREGKGVLIFLIGSFQNRENT
jgi:hypothetical protein